MLAKCVVSTIAIAWATGAAALDLPSTEPTAQPAGASAPAAEIEPEEILVTAQRRSERLVDVPISIATATPAELEQAGPTSLENLTKITPGVYLQRGAYGLSPTVRGIGSTLSSSGGEQIVALYIDEIYYPTPTGNIFDLSSVAGVELLKGPQGTLFGRNATGGAILLRTLDPGYDRAGRFNVSYENLDEIRANGYVNVPLGDKVAFNAAVGYRWSDGYVHDLRTGRSTNPGRNFTARGKLLLEPADGFSLILTASHADFNDSTGTDLRNLQPAPLVRLLSGGPISTARRVSTFAIDQYIKTSTDELSARGRLDLWDGTLSTFTAWLNNKLDARNDLTGSYLPYDVALSVRTKTFSQEVNFASAQDKPLSYVAGVYYFRNRARVPTITQNGAPLFFSANGVESIAGYIDGTYTFGKLSLIAGLRYTYEDRTGQSGFGSTAATGTVTRFQKGSDRQWTPRVGLRYAVDDRSNLYATYSRGFKSGGFDLTTPTGPGVRPETVDAFEAGFKHGAGNLTFSTAAFYYLYNDTQVNATISGQNGSIFNQMFNVPKSRIYGAEADATLKLNDNFDIRAAIAYTHARYIDFKTAPGYIVNPADPATLGGLLFSNVSLDVSGKTMVRSPELTASGTLNYHVEVGDGDKFALSISPYYSSRVYFTFDNALSQKPYFTLDARATLTLNERLMLSIFGRNLTDSAYKTNAAQNALGLNTVAYARPRSYGASIGYSF